MTFFLKITQAILQEELSNIVVKSKQKDESYANYLATLAGMGRNVVLSGKKRELAGKYSGTLWMQSFLAASSGQEKEVVAQDQEEKVEKSSKERRKDGKSKHEKPVAPVTPGLSKPSIAKKSKDEGYLDDFKKLLDQCQIEAKAASDKAKQGQGSFGPDIDRLKILVDRIFAKLNEVHLLENECTEDPLNIFRYHMASYFTKRVLIVWTKENSYLGQTMATGIELTSQKEQLVLTSLQTIEEDLEVLNMSHPRYAQKRKKDVITEIERLIKNNKEVCKQHGIPIMTTAVTAVSSLLTKTIFGGSPTSAPMNSNTTIISPDVGLLDQCCKAALEEIESLGLEPAKAEENKFDMV